MSASDFEREPNNRTSRRSFLKRVGAASLLTGAGYGTRLLKGEVQEVKTGKPGMILRRDRPLNLEAPRHALKSWLTPTDFFYVRNHYDNPEVDPQKWRLAIGGEVETTASLSLNAIRKLPKVTIVCPLECTGNGRAYFKPPTRGNQWEVGAVGNAVWSGVRFRELLKGVGIGSAGRFVTLRGGERLPTQRVPRFVRSVPLEKAMADAIVAYEMNGEPLAADHGYPLRAVIPGWYGASSVKWLQAIDVTPEADPGRYQQASYRLTLKDQKVEDSAYANVVNVKSVIAQPAPGRVPAGAVPVHGVAWTGQGEIAKVEFSADGGKTWQGSELTSPTVPHAWQTWFLLWQAVPGRYKLMCRATDTTARTQPLHYVWNQKGYANNGSADHALEVTVA